MRGSDMHDPTLILFAKSPIPGQVKTRMQPQCSAEQAADLAEILIEETVRAAVAGWPGEVELCTWPDTNHGLFSRLAGEHHIGLSSQGSGNLGDKMLHAMERAGFPSAVIGCDVPHCPPGVFLSAFEALKDGSNIIGPSSDGGYYLIGLQQARPVLFGGIGWGGSNVLEETLLRSSRAGINLVSLDALVDIDTFADLLQVSPGIPQLARWLEKQGL